jgi:preprotein translocase subunit Sss1
MRKKKKGELVRTSTGTRFEWRTPEGPASFGKNEAWVCIYTQPIVPTEEQLKESAAANVDAYKRFATWVRARGKGDTAGTAFACACCRETISFMDTRTAGAVGAVQPRETASGQIAEVSAENVKDVAMCTECVWYSHRREKYPDTAQFVRMTRRPTRQELLALPAGMLSEQALMVLSVLQPERKKRKS